MSWWQNFRERYLFVLALVPVFVVVYAVVRPGPLSSSVFRGAFTAAMVLIAGTVDYLRRKHSDTITTLSESRSRARPHLPPLAQLDISRPIVGIGHSGPLEDQYALIRLDDRDAPNATVTVESGAIFDPFLFVAKEVPLDELQSVLSEEDIWVLPQSKYSDAIAHENLGMRRRRGREARRAG